MSNLRAYAKHDKVILKPLESEDNVVGVIAVADIGGNKANQYEIVDVGPGIYNTFTGVLTPTQFCVGDRVFVHKAHVHELQVDGQKLYVTRENEILCGISEVVELDENFVALLNGIGEDESNK